MPASVLVRPSSTDYPEHFGTRTSASVPAGNLVEIMTNQSQ